MSETKETESSSKRVRCLNDKNSFFGLMTKEKPNDCAHTIKEQIATEALIQASYEEFIDSFSNDPE